MAVDVNPEVVLYDLACVKNVCFSPYVWRIRLMLNYKRIPYRTVFLEFPDIEPTLKALGLQPGHHGLQKKYTVPVIKHIPTDRHITDSAAIAQFLDSTYPNPCVPLTSSLGDQIEARLPSVLGTAFKTSLIPRQSLILSPQARDHFNSTREANLGHPIMDLLEGDGEEKAWATAAEDIRAIGEMILTKKSDGPFLLGENPSYNDFVIVGYLQCARTVDEGVFQRLVQNPGLRTVYNACLPLIVLKKD